MCYIILNLIYIHMFNLIRVFSRNRCISLPNSCNKATPENTNQRNDGNRIMTEQFPTLGNWVARMSKKQATKSKSKLQSGINLPTASTAEAARVSYIFTNNYTLSMNYFESFFTDQFFTIFSRIGSWTRNAKDPLKCTK